jgi:maleylpyruvate isomerase
MPRPSETLLACAASHARLVADVANMSENNVREPSRLPNWSRAHLITHLARNADSFSWLVDGARLGERRQQYPEVGMRDRDIAAGSTRSKSELYEDLALALEGLEVAWSKLGDDQWTIVQDGSSGELEMSEIVFRRLREVEIHHVDLDVGYSASDWPALYVEGELRRQLERLPGRADHTSLVAWLVGRSDVPEFDPWW